MENNIKRMYWMDCAILGSLAALLVFIVGFVLCSLGQVPGGGGVWIAIIASGMMALGFAFTGMATVMSHLRKNSGELYAVDARLDGVQLDIKTMEGEAV